MDEVPTKTLPKISGALNSLFVLNASVSFLLSLRHAGQLHEPVERTVNSSNFHPALE
jgi:hypothetical protein